MIDYNSLLPVISIHIPKTGGSSFLDVLKYWYKDGLYNHRYNEKYGIKPRKKRLKKIWNDEYKNNICIHGHFNKRRGLGIDEYYPEVKQFFTILRDPLEVAISNFFYVKKLEKKGTNYRESKRIFFEEDINEYLLNSKPFIFYHFPNGMNHQNYKDFLHSKFIHIGVLEKFQKSIDILAEKLNKPKYTVNHRNKSNRYDLPEKYVIEKYKEKCELEYLVYEFALSLNETI